MFHNYSKITIITDQAVCFFGNIFPKKLIFVISLLTLFGFPLKAQNCPVPIPLNITNITTESATVSWFQSGSPDSFDVSIRTVPGSYPPEPQFVGILASPFEISKLESGVLYEFRIRSRCDLDISNWSQPRRFITQLTNPSSCQLNLPLGDNNCGGLGDVFRIFVEEAPGDALGTDVFIEKINLIIDHTWPADLNIRLRSPSGFETVLSADNGIGGNHYGNPSDTICFSSTTFSDQACTLISDAFPPFIGSFKPENPLSSLYDGSNPIGLWELLICDKAPGDIGTLHFFEIIFERNNCLPPEAIITEIIGDNQLQIVLYPGYNCDSILVELGPEGFIPLGLAENPDEDVVLYFFSCQSDTLVLSGLESNKFYEFYLYSICDTLLSAPSCVEGFSTNCPAPSLNSNFDSEELCASSCLVYCELSAWWRNKNKTGAQWQINSGPTPTEGTGPEQAEKGFGNYIFFNASSPLCHYPEMAVLESACLEIFSTGDDCDFSFSYHMWGPEVSSLYLLLSTDGGFEWDTLWHATGNQGNEWLQADIELSDYHGLVGKFRFVAGGSESGRGDIALDNILMYHGNLVDNSSLIYFVDADGDGYGLDGTETFFCTFTPPEGWADQGGDCDDENPDINPGAEVIPCNLIDENCTGLEDDQPIDNPITHQLISLTHESCSAAADGSIEITVAGGNPPYRIQWNTGDTSSSIQSLTAGVYYAIIADADSCLYRTDFYEIQTVNSADLTFVNIQRPSCSSFNNGSIEILVGGGSAPFNYEWNTGDSNPVLTDIYSGNYQVTVTDADSCVYVSQLFHLRPMNPFEIQVAELVQPNCYGDENGAINIQIIGGSSPFHYQWSNGDSTAVIEQLPSGYYHLTVTDSNDCEVFKDSIFLGQPKPLLAVYPTISSPLCPGQSTAKVLTEIQGGTFPYTFFWQEGNKTYNTKDLINVAAGNYMLTVTDFRGCHFYDQIMITAPDSFHTELTQLSNVSCGSRKDGAISVKVSGGWPPYEIFWSDGSVNDFELNDLAPGFYQFTISDQADCKYSSEEFDIENSNLPLEINLFILDSISCYQVNDGSIRGEVNSDFGPFIFDWNHLNPILTDSSFLLIENVSPNNYLLTVTDATACKGTSQPLLLTEPADLIITDILEKKPTCFGDSDGMLIPVFSGGTSPYTFEWSNGTNGDTASFLKSGHFHLTISDKNNCRRTRTNIFLGQPDPIMLSFEITGSREGQNEGEVQLFITGGIAPYEVFWDERITRFSNEKASELNPGQYQLSLIDDNGCQLDSFFVIDLITGTFTFEENQWQLYPNPTDSDLFLKVFEEIPLDNFSFILKDLTGKHYTPLVTQPSGTADLRIILPDFFSNGTYFLEVKNELSGARQLFPFVVQRK